MPKIHGKIEDIDRDTFIREISIESGFSIADTKTFLDALQRVFTKAILTKAPLSVRGLGHLTFSVVPERKGFNARKYRMALITNPDANKEDFYEIYPETIRMNFQLSQNLRDLIRLDGKKKIR